MRQEVIICKDSLQRVFDIIEDRQLQLVEWQDVLYVGGHMLKDFIERYPLRWKRKVGNGYMYPTRLEIQDFEKDLFVLQSQYENGRPEVIVAVGGGRIIDSAKYLIHLMMRESGREIPFFIAIPTTAGSGSEATPFAVVYDRKKKLSVSHENLLPQLVLLDYTLLPPAFSKQRGLSGIDAVCQAIESMWSKNANEESVKYAKLALELLWKNLPLFINGSVKGLGKTIQWAAYLSGKAISITRTTGCHALSYYLTAHFNVPHGQAVAFFLPSFFIYNYRAASPERMKIIYEIIGAGDDKEAFHKTTQFMNDCRIATRFSEINIHVSTDELLQSVNEERFANNPAPFDADKLKQLIRDYIT